LAPDQTNLLQGTPDMMILKALALGDPHGLGVSRRIEQTTKGTFQVKPGSFFPALHRMEEQGWLVASGRVGKQEARQILQANQCGTTPTGSGDQPLGPHCAGDNPDTRSLLKETL
jgi:DNA-binding PadR family transcriptional regulator